MKIDGKTDIGKTRSENQDNFRSGVFSDGISWGVVCDGMGGANNGKLASLMAVECIEDQLVYSLSNKNDEETDYQHLLEDSISLANGEVFARSGEGRQIMGTTVVCALVDENTLHLAHVGDSRAYLYYNGELQQLTRDHSIVQELVDRGSLTDDEARTHPEKNVITRALGVDMTVDVEYQKLEMPPGAILLLCSDGLTNMVDPVRIAEVLANLNFYDQATELVSDALLAGGSDNITVLLMQAEGRGE